MTDGGRARGTTPSRLAVIVVATLLGGMIAAVAVIGANAIEPRLTDAATAALRDAGLDGVEVRFEGREALVSGEGASSAELEEAAEIVQALDGVRWVGIAEPAAEEPEPDPEPTPDPSTEPQPEPPAALTAAERERLERATFRFLADGATLDEPADARIAEVADLMSRHPDLRIRLVGHIAIVTGTPDEVRVLCEARAQVVADALIAAGVAADRLETRSAGADEPIADNGTQDGAAQNRRVSIEIVEAD